MDTLYRFMPEEHWRPFHGMGMQMNARGALFQHRVHHGAPRGSAASAPRHAARWNGAIHATFVALALMAVGHGSAIAASPETISAVGVENQYADVISQIGGPYVQVSAIVTDPNTDPHSFEVSPRVAMQIAAASLVIKNGVGYDFWVDKIIAAAPNADRKVIDVQQLLNLPDSTPNPHLWYDPKTMPAVARAVAYALSALEPAEADYFEANTKAFEASLEPWFTAIASFKASFRDTPVAANEPVADYLLQALGCNIATPFSFEEAIMNGTDPSPQDVTTQTNLLREKQVKVLVYNRQVTDPLTQSLLGLAKQNGIPIVGVYETMPAPGYNYQSWMLAEVTSLRKAVADKVSTETLLK